MQENRNRVAVIIIDMQEHFVASLSDNDRGVLIEEQKKLIRTCGDLGRPLFVFEYVGSRFGRTVRAVRECADLVPGCKTVAKERNSCFEWTNLDNDLKAQGVNTVILSGVNASFCVIESALGGVDCGFRVLTSERLIADDVYYAERGKSLGEYKSRNMLSIHEDLLRGVPERTPFCRGFQRHANLLPTRLWPWRRRKFSTLHADATGHNAVYEI